MGEWYDYNIRFKDNGPEIHETLIKDGYASLETNKAGNTDLRLYLSRIDEAIKDHDLVKNSKDPEIRNRYLGYYYRDRENKPFDSIIVRMVRHDHGDSFCPDSIFYVNKWVPNNAIPLAISALYPERLVEVIETAPYFDRDTTSYIKNGDWVNKEGEKLVAGLWGINPKFIKEPKDGMARVSLPVGDENDKWGSFMTPLKNISGYVYSGGVVENNTVFFTEKTIRLSFKNSIKTYPVKDLVKEFYEAKNNFRDYARESMILENVPPENLKKHEGQHGDFYVLNVHLEEGRSYSLTVPDHSVGNDGCVNLGERKRARNTRIVEENGRFEQEYISNEKIKKAYDTYPQREEDMEQEEDAEMDL